MSETRDAVQVADTSIASPVPTHAPRRYTTLVAAFAAWMFAGLHIHLFILIHRQMMLGLLGSTTVEAVITRWFAWYQAAFLFGAAGGGWLFGMLGDRLGRSRSLALAVFCYSGFTLIGYTIESAEWMLVVRCLACFGIGGVWPNAVALVAEAFPGASRPLLAGLLGTAANVGPVLLGTIALTYLVTLDSWRWTLLVGASPALLGIWILFAVPESARWLQSRSAAICHAATRSPIADVLRPPLLSRTILGIALGAIPVVGTAANANWLIPWADQVNNRLQAAPTEGANEALAVSRGPSADTDSSQPKATRGKDPRSKAWTMITRSGGAVFGSLLGGVLAVWLGRRTTYFLIVSEHSRSVRTSSRN